MILQSATIAITRREPRRACQVLVTLTLLALAFAEAPRALAQLDTGFSRFMGSNFSNGQSSLGAPAGTLNTTSTTAGSGIPATASNGKLVLMATSGPGCYATVSTGSGLSLKWARTFTSLTCNTDQAAIDNSGNVYFTAYNSSTSYLYAMDLNSTNSNGTINWSISISSGMNQPRLTGSPAVGHNGNVYCITTKPPTGNAKLYAFKDVSGTPTQEWSWSDSGPYSTSFTQPIAYYDGTDQYILLMGLAVTTYFGGRDTPTIRMYVLKDSGTSVSEVGYADFPDNGNAMMTQPPSYQPNGSASLSPDANTIVVPWVYVPTSGSYLYGTSAWAVTWSTGKITRDWPSLPASVYTPPSSSVYEVSGPSNPVTYTATFDGSSSGSTNTYYVYADGQTFVKRDISTGAATTLFTLSGSNQGCELPVFDSNSHLWVGTTGGSVYCYNTSGTNLATVNIGSSYSVIWNNGTIGSAMSGIAIAGSTSTGYGYATTYDASNGTYYVWQIK